MRRRILLFFMCLLLPSMFTSCYGAREIDQMAYVMAVGIERGVENKWRVSFLIPAMKGASSGSSQGVGGNGGGGNELFVYTVDAPSFFAAVNHANTVISRKLNFFHTKLMVFSEDSAKKGDIGTMATSLLRYRETRRTTRVIVVPGSAKEFLQEVRPVIGTIISKYIETLIQESNDTGFFPNIRLNEIYSAMLSGNRQPIAIVGAINNFKRFKEKGERWEGPPEAKEYFAGEVPRTGGGKVELVGSIIGVGNKMVEKLGGFETRILLIARGEFERLYFTVNDPKDPDKIVAVELKEARRPKVKVEFDGDKPIISLKLQLEGDIMSIQSRFNYETVENKKIIEKEIEKTIKTQLDSLIKKCQDLKSDVFGFGFNAVRHFGTIQEWEEYNWNERFKEAEVITEIKFTVRRTGAIIKSLTIEPREEE